MATQEYRIVSAEDSDIHDEPHIDTDANEYLPLIMDRDSSRCSAL